MTKLAIVIVNYNSAHVLPRLLDSLPAALAGQPAEVLVVDNGSTDASLAELAGRTDIQLIPETNRGYSGGINVGLRNCPDADAVLILNPDMVLLPDSIKPLLAVLGDERVGIVAPKVLTAEGGLYRSLRREPSLARAMGLNWLGHPFFAEYVSSPEAYERAGDFDWALGAALLISRRCLDLVGDWDESYFLYSEETDYCLRARDLGLRTRYEPASSMIHIGGQSGQNERTHAMQIINRVRLYRRRHGVAASWLYYLLTIASELTWAVRAGRKSRFAVAALLRPALRPAELGCGSGLLPA